MHTFSLKTLEMLKTCLHSTCAKRKRCNDVTLSGLEEVQGATLRVHSTGISRPVETQDVFFWRLAGQSAPTKLAIVHWIGCINAIKLGQ